MRRQVRSAMHEPAMPRSGRARQPLPLSPSLALLALSLAGCGSGGSATPTADQLPGGGVQAHGSGGSTATAGARTDGGVAGAGAGSSAGGISETASSGAGDGGTTGNRTPIGLEHFAYIRVTDQHELTFGLAFGDVDGDSQLDIVSGRYWYKNPGGDLSSAWQQSASLPDGLHAVLVTDVDGDAHLDVIAWRQSASLDLYWLEANGSTWNKLPIGQVPVASHSQGAQGYTTGQLEAGGKAEIAVTSGQGIFYFVVPSDPTTGSWPRKQVSSRPSDEGLALADFNQDGFVDVVATTGGQLGVEWYENPQDGSSDWRHHAIASLPDYVFPDRCAAADFNGDGKADVITTEENGGDKEAESHVWFGPAEQSGSWSGKRITSQGSTNAMDVGDIDNDGDVDVVLGEHRGALRLTIAQNDGKGSFTLKPVDSGKESHLGARLVDLDQDGDLDIVSIAYSDAKKVHLWRHDP